MVIFGGMKKILVEVDGKMVNIVDLSREDYELFLKRMHQLIIGYKVIVGYKGEDDTDTAANRSRD